MRPGVLPAGSNPSPYSNPNPNQERFSRASGWRPACGRQWRASPTSAHSMARWPLVPPLAAALRRQSQLSLRRYGYQGLGPVGTSATATLLVAPRGTTACVKTVGPTSTPPPNLKPNPNPSPIPNPSFSPGTNPKPNPYPELNPNPNLSQVGPTQPILIVRWARIVLTAARATLLTSASLTRSRNA